MFKVYKIETYEYFYFGFTYNIKERENCHNSRLNGGCNYKLYQKIRDHNGFYIMNVLFEYQTKEEALKKENELISENLSNSLCLNCRRSFRTLEDRRLQNLKDVRKYRDKLTEEQKKEINQKRKITYKKKKFKKKINFFQNLINEKENLNN